MISFNDFKTKNHINFDYKLQEELTKAMFTELHSTGESYELENQHQIDIIKWGVERTLVTYQKENEKKIIDEEMEELKNAAENNDTNEMLDALSDCYVVLTQTFAKAGLNGKLIGKDGWLSTMYNFYLDIPKRIESLGYCFDCVMQETIKEISSRVQDPEQKKRWEDGRKEKSEKWQKWKEQPEDTKYKANYEKCKKSNLTNGNDFLTKRFMEVQ